MTEIQIGDKIRVRKTIDETVVIDGEGDVFIDGNYMYALDLEDEGFTVEVIERPYKKADEYAVGDVVRTGMFVPFIKVQENQWASVGGNGMFFTDAEMVEDKGLGPYVDESSVLVAHIDNN